MLSEAGPASPQTMNPSDTDTTSTKEGSDDDETSFRLTRGVVLSDAGQNPVLPILETTGPLRFSPQEGAAQPFSMTRLTWALQNKLTHGSLLAYLSFYQRPQIASAINQEIGNIPAIFYAVATNNDKIVRTWIEYGGNPDAVEPGLHLPLLAFAITYADTIEQDTTAVVMTLLSLGADASVIPKAFYSPFLRDVPVVGPDAQELTDLEDQSKAWCTDVLIAKLARTCNLTQRYFIEKKMRSKKPSVRQKQAAEQHHVTPFFHLPFFLIGQDVAVSVLIESLLSYLLIPNEKPLVLFFAGMSSPAVPSLSSPDKILRKVQAVTAKPNLEIA